MGEEKYYKIGEAARLLQLEPHVLRFWETQFRQLMPVRTNKGQRLYSQRHMELLRRIQYLLYQKGMTIEGARQALDGKSSQGENPEFLESIRQELLEIQKLLSFQDE